MRMSMEGLFWNREEGRLRAGWFFLAVAAKWLVRASVAYAAACEPSDRSSGPPVR